MVHSGTVLGTGNKGDFINLIWRINMRSRIMPPSKMSASWSLKLAKRSVFMTKETLQVLLRILRWRNDPRLSRWVQCNHKVFIREREAGETVSERDAMTGLKMVHYWLWGWRKEPWAKDYSQPWEDGKNKVLFFPEPPEGT